jgi:hypothetical protein
LLKELSIELFGYNVIVIGYLPALDGRAHGQWHVLMYNSRAGEAGYVSSRPGDHYDICGMGEQPLLWEAVLTLWEGRPGEFRWTKKCRRQGSLTGGTGVEEPN